jgi:SSS family solute:Na+ symporter
MNNIFAAVCVGYLFLLGLTGVYFSRKLKSVEDFLVAGRRLTLPLTSASLMATWTGAAAVTGYTGWIYEFGYSMVWIAVATTSSLLLMALVLSKRLRRLALLTVPDILEKYYDRRTKHTGAFIIALYCIGIVSGELLGGAHILSAVLGWDFYATLLLTAAIVIGYCLLGGLWAVAVTDLFQFFLLSGGLAAAVVLTLHNMGGWSALHHQVSLLAPDHLHVTAYAGVETIVAWFIIIFASNFIAPDIYQRMYAAKTERTARLSLGLTGLWDVFLTMAALILGLSAFLYFQGSIETDLALPQLLVELYPGAFSSVLMVALLAVIMSTADSLLVVAGGTVYHDVLGLTSGLKQVRLFTAVCGVISVGLCFYFESIMDSILFSSSVYAAGLFIPVVSCFIWKKGTKDAAFYSCLAGGGVTCAWRILGWGLDPVLPGIFVCLLLFVGISVWQTKFAIGIGKE